MVLNVGRKQFSKIASCCSYVLYLSLYLEIQFRLLIFALPQNSIIINEIKLYKIQFLIFISSWYPCALIMLCWSLSSPTQFLLANGSTNFYGDHRIQSLFRRQPASSVQKANSAPHGTTRIFHLSLLCTCSPRVVFLSPKQRRGSSLGFFDLLVTVLKTDSSFSVWVNVKPRVFYCFFLFWSLQTPRQCLLELLSPLQLLPSLPMKNRIGKIIILGLTKLNCGSLAKVS